MRFDSLCSHAMDDTKERCERHGCTYCTNTLLCMAHEINATLQDAVADGRVDMTWDQVGKFTRHVQDVAERFHGDV